MAYVADRSGLRIVEVGQNRFDLARNVGQSHALNSTSDAIVRARLGSTQVNSVGWELSAGDLEAMDRAFPPPVRETPLAMI